MPFRPVRYLVLLTLPAASSSDTVLHQPLAGSPIKALEIFRDWQNTHPSEPQVELVLTSPYHALFGPETVSRERISYTEPMSKYRSVQIIEILRDKLAQYYTAIFFAMSPEDRDILHKGVLSTSLLKYANDTPDFVNPIPLEHVTWGDGNEEEVATALSGWFTAIEPLFLTTIAEAQQLAKQHKSLINPEAVGYRSIMDSDSLLIISNVHAWPLDHAQTLVEAQYSKWREHIPFVPVYHDVYHISLVFPWSESPARVLCRAILQAIGMDNIHKLARTTNFQEQPKFVQNYMDAVANRTGDSMHKGRGQLLETYLHDHCSQSELCKLG